MKFFGVVFVIYQNMRKKKRKLITYTFAAHPYPSDVCIIVGETREAAVAKFRKLSGETMKLNDNAAATTVSLRDPKTKKHVVFIILTYDAAKCHIIAHEAVHAVNFIYDEMGVEWDLENDEPHAYFLGQIVLTIDHAVKS